MDYLSLGCFKPGSNGFFATMRGFFPFRKAMPCPLKCLCNSSGDENALRHTLQTFCRERNGFDSLSSITSLASSSSSSSAAEAASVLSASSGWSVCPKSVCDLCLSLGLMAGSCDLPRLWVRFLLGSEGTLSRRIVSTGMIKKVLLPGVHLKS